MEVLEDVIIYREAATNKGWKHGKAYQKNCQKNIKLKKGNFSRKNKKIDSNFT
jgi:hypothetical protein